MVNNYNDMMYKTTKKTIIDLGQDIGEGGEDTTKETEILFSDKAIVKYKKQILQLGDNISELNDNIEFIMLREIPVNSYIGFNNAWYKVISIDNTIKGIYKMYTKFYTNCATDKSIYDITIQNRSIIHIKVGEKVQLNCICTKNGTQENAPFITYSSSDSSIANIDKNGLITGLQEGSAGITCNYNGVNKAITIIIDKADEYSIECTDITLDAGAIAPLMYHLYKNGVENTDDTPIFTSADTNIATVSDLGDVTGVAQGNTTILLKWQGVTKVVNVTVNATNYKIIGENIVKHKSNYTYTLSPTNDNCTWELDEDSIDLELAEIIEQSNEKCIIYTNEVDANEVITLYAKYGDNVLAELNITIRRY